MASRFSTKIPSLSAIFSIYTSLSAFTMLFKTILREIIPTKIRDFIVSKFKDYFSSYFNPNFTFIIEEKSDLVPNQIFRAAQVYLPTLLTRISTGSLLVSSRNLNNPIAKPKFGIPVKAKITDEFEGIPLEWTLHSEKDTDTNPFQKSKQIRYFHLTCKKDFRDKIMSDYFSYIAKSSVKILAHRDNLKIYTYNSNRHEWQSAIFQHHTTFETLAMEPELKNTLIRDLDAFSSGKDFFKTVGRAWKRGYLLYGPPGTGKSSLVAAIANYMNFNVYDLQIQSVEDDEMLRQILTMTQNRSILLVEDLDCAGADARNEDKEDNENIQDMNKKKKKKKKKDPQVPWSVTLSGLLNFVDGLWSSCVEERIIIFTTNHKEKLDPALLRPGRMDVHILMDYCTPAVFKKLAALYLNIEEHFLVERIGNMLLEVKATPAEITEQLMVSKNPEVALKGIVEFLISKN
ncbi:PREDICTED: AAA-ATPase At1g43910-like isoform X1 [Camelina sativa]|uniref:AAA-ATPase At1g43910-like isoform X1 n=1 Tax=Camelina sativa TaxID=90675 RepID=A0ABM0T8C7_CAMSA|nr:PREDICTED: AAA-ATPase At1g43910-like isoform X1 [Camelina sativa]